mmetsp:Transcript_14898/g.52274  ORF Transcript_14898/g.52274 Transcript_14898/m.52274 type:complete len:217 (-) Transcript_14898:81-731(-)
MGRGLACGSPMPAATPHPAASAGGRSCAWACPPGAAARMNTCPCICAGADRWPPASGRPFSAAAAAAEAPEAADTEVAPRADTTGEAATATAVPDLSTSVGPGATADPTRRTEASAVAEAAAPAAGQTAVPGAAAAGADATCDPMRRGDVEASSTDTAPPPTNAGAAATAAGGGAAKWDPALTMAAGRAAGAPAFITVVPGMLPGTARGACSTKLF